METISAAATAIPIHRNPSNYNEIAMQQSLLFADSLKDLKNLRTQLYSAAEYFELSYMDDEQKHIVVETLKDYAIRALVNTVDHLGSVSYKVNDVLDEKVEEIAEMDIRVSCIEQRLRTCQEYSDREGVSQQSSVINTPKYHKRYTLAAGETLNTANRENLKIQASSSLEDADDWYQFRTAVRATIRETPSTSFRKGRSVSPSLRYSRPPVGTFSFSANTTPIKEHGNSDRSVSPHRFPLLRSGSLATRMLPKPISRQRTPNSSVDWKRFSLAPQKSSSMRVYDVKELDNNGNNSNHEGKELHRAPSKSKRLLKTLLSRRKSKKDETLYTYLDEY